VSAAELPVVEVRPVRRWALAMRCCAKRASVREVDAQRWPPSVEASEGRGGRLKKRRGSDRMAEANKAFSHFRF